MGMVSVRQHLARRIDRMRFALACDDEANIHYQLTPFICFRVKIACLAFVLK
jgi:hypothetical protein